MSDTPEDEGARPSERRRARAWLLQVHYRWEAGGRQGSLREALGTTMESRRISPRRLPYIRRVVGVLDEHGEEVDEAIRRSLENWRLERLSAIDRAVLRVAAAEILYLDDVPPKVSIKEAVALAERYGVDESPRFVNGVLDGLWRRADPGAADSADSAGGTGPGGAPAS